MMLVVILSTVHLDVCPYMQCYTVLLGHVTPPTVEYLHFCHVQCFTLYECNLKLEVFRQACLEVLSTSMYVGSIM